MIRADLAAAFRSAWDWLRQESARNRRSLRGRLSGLCQPTYVLDIPGGAGKSPIGPNYLVSIGDANGAPQYEVEDFNGRRHAYPPATSAHRKKDALTVAKSSRC